MLIPTGFRLLRIPILLGICFILSACGANSPSLPDGAVLVNGEPWCSPDAGPPQEQLEAGLGGLLPGTGEMVATCKWTCGGATLLYGFDEDIAEWIAIGGGADPAVEGGFTAAAIPDGLPTCALWE